MGSKPCTGSSGAIANFLRMDNSVLCEGGMYPLQRALSSKSINKRKWPIKLREMFLSMLQLSVQFLLTHHTHYGGFWPPSGVGNCSKPDIMTRWLYHINLWQIPWGNNTALYCHGDNYDGSPSSIMTAPRVGWSREWVLSKVGPECIQMTWVISLTGQENWPKKKKT